MEKKKTIGIITFHASHNYGSMLQAYALQYIINSMGFHSEIINFRTQRQKYFYTPKFLKGGFKSRVKELIIQIPYLYDILRKQTLFEDFLKNNLRVTDKEYTTLEELFSAHFDYDIYLSGSDQIWNFSIFDFDEAYMLPFVHSGKKIAYAASAGHSSEDFARQEATGYVDLISKYDHISVREAKAAHTLSSLIGKNVDVTIDPTLLLPVKEWDAFAGNQPIIDYNYMLEYSPSRSEIINNVCDSLANRLKIKAIKTIPYEYLSDKKVWPHITPHLATGPKEFLNLVKFSKFVICRSFHGVVFSILFNKPFICIDSIEDIRINQILDICNMRNRNLPDINVITIENFSIPPTNALEKLEPFIQESLSWLRTSLNS